MGKKLDPEKEENLKVGYFRNLNFDQNAKAAGVSIGAAHSHMKSMEAEIAESGLLSVLEKYGLKEAKQVAMLNGILIANDTSAEECFRVMPLAQRLAAGHIDADKMGNVVDQVFASCPPELAAQFAATITEYAQERAKNGNLTLREVRSEYHAYTTSTEELKTKRSSLTTEVQGLETRQVHLVGRVNGLEADEQARLKRLAGAGQTDASLKQYEADRIYFHDVLHVDIADVSKSRQFFEEMGRLGYSSDRVLGFILNNPPLSRLAQTLGEEVRNLSATWNGLKTEIAQLDGKKIEREKATKAAQERAIKAERDAETKINAANKRVKDILAKEEMTIKDIEETKDFKKQLREVGLEP